MSREDLIYALWWARTMEMPTSERQLEKLIAECDGK